MNMFVFKRASLPTALIALSLSAVQGSIFTISDDRIRNMDITPVLGRGYSIMTNQFHSTCLMVDETTVPSYNYDCELPFLLIFRSLLHIALTN